MALAAAVLAGCSTVSKVGSIVPFTHRGRKIAENEANRIPVLALNGGLAVSPSLKGQQFYLPPPAPMTDWPVPGGALDNSVENVDAAPAFVVAWRRGIGVGYSRQHFVIAPPIAAGGRIFVMDGEANVSAHDARTGAQIWRTSIKPRMKRAHTAFGGGLAYADGKLYVSSGFREVVQLDAATGRLGWRTMTDAPIHAAPTVADGRVFVSDVNDQLLAFDTTTGQQDWTYQALSEPARILAASSPAVVNDTVVTSFASGELIAVRAENGNPLWDANLSQANETNALSEIRDIPGRPVVYKNDVYAVSHANVFAATDLRTGTPRWTLPISAITTPWPAGDVVFVIDQTGQVICAAREGGDVYWITDLNAPTGKKKRDKHPAYWSSPVLASSRLITVSSKGEAVALNPETGAVVGRLRLGQGAMVGPIAVDGMVYVVSEQGELIAIR
ncbi:MAG TPA: PQQ-binding-like beta-propeller repeat protein [Caulobacteraceae bacterium]|nr:PQQ-binding-like beta-propeller repeat protein [Caulobacteraceae bacterium]